MIRLKSFGTSYRAAVWGASGGIGRAFVRHLADDPACASVVGVSRTGIPESGKIGSVIYDPHGHETISEAAATLAEGGAPQVMIIATGTLHGQGYEPEKALRQLREDAFLEVMRINALLPAMIAQALLPRLPEGRSVLAALSARVGSISDNRLGGWHSYRASKAALNMLVRNIAIEAARKHRDAVVAGLHPGTVDTSLSEPFQANVPEGKLFTPEYSAGKLLKVIDSLEPSQSGETFDYAGKLIAP
jgi:NAD(P)-dependent dehydrogenase (short-subunit alcohol dehydrogenase family)